jgi:hypothetical protein
MEITGSTRYRSQVPYILLSQELNNLVQQLNSQADINKKNNINKI